MGYYVCIAGTLNTNDLQMDLQEWAYIERDWCKETMQCQKFENNTQSNHFKEAIQCILPPVGNEIH